RRLASTGADLECRAAAVDPGGGDQIVDERVGIARSRQVVALGHLTEDESLLSRHGPREPGYELAPLLRATQRKPMCEVEVSIASACRAAGRERRQDVG